MKKIAALIGVAMACSGWLTAGAAGAEEAFARITSIQIEKDNVVVRVEAAASLAKVTLESSTRVGRKAWEPRGVYHLADGGEGTVNLTFEVPLSPAVEILRVRGDFRGEILSASFYEGTNKFVAATGGASGEPVFAAPGVTDRMAAPGESAGDTRSVVESDIWKIDGDTLYFFNQNRGLQVIDVANPDRPALTGTYDLAASGEQMYVLNRNQVVLLARDDCSWYGSAGGSRVILLEVKDGAPELVKELPVPGYIAESRLVGSALYVVANSYEERAVPAQNGTAASTEWVWGSRVVSFDLSDFAAAAVKSQDWVSGYGNVIYATDRYLFVAQTNYEWRTGAQDAVFNSYDISSPDGAFVRLATFKSPGTVRDKFKMQVSGDVFSVVLQVDARRPQATYLRTFSLADPRNPQPLAELKIIENEQLFATRFAGDRLYVVTFFIIDPLWIIDLRDPAAPKIVGELEIPGWSTYLQPLGDRLLAIGLDQTNGTRRTAVQLFDVADPAKPSLLSKVLIGEQWSESEANWDEKAFGVLPEDKLVLVPFWSSGNNGFSQGVQLIDLEPDTLVKRGVVAHKMGARRATLHRGRLLSLSSQELLTVNAADRDRPVVIQSTELSWAADRVHLAGDFIIEVDGSGSGAPALRVVRADDPSALIRTVSLKNLPYMGSTVLGDSLYVLQGKPLEVVYPAVYHPDTYKPIGTNPPVLQLARFDLSALPELRPAGETTKQAGTEYFYGQYEAIQTGPSTLVWRSKNSGYYPWWRGGPVPVDGGPVAFAAVDRIAPIWWGGGGAAGHFIAVDTAALAFASEIRLSDTGGWWNFGEAFAVGSRIYTSHQASEYDETIDPPPYESQCYNDRTRQWEKCVIDPPPGIWVQRYYLDVIDFSDPADPLVRKPVNLPGSLIGVAKGGELLYTRGYNIKPFDLSAADETLSASSYDGVEVHWIASMGFGENWPRPAVANGAYIYLGAAPGKENNTATLQTWTLNGAGKFERVSSQTLDSPAQQLRLVRDILAVQTSDILLMDVRNAAEPKLAGSGRATACYGVLFDAADGKADRGLWIPAGWYGVVKVPVKNGQQP